MKTIQLIIEAAILLSLIVVCVLLAGKRTVKVDGDVRLTHSQVSDIVDAIEGEDEKQWEYLVVLFERGDNMNAIMEELGRTGWEYAGPLANNGLNAQYVAFMKPKRAQEMKPKRAQEIKAPQDGPRPSKKAEKKKAPADGNPPEANNTRPEANKTR